MKMAETTGQAREFLEALRATVDDDFAGVTVLIGFPKNRQSKPRVGRFAWRDFDAQCAWIVRQQADCDVYVSDSLFDAAWSASAPAHERGGRENVSACVALRVDIDADGPHKKRNYGITPEQARATLDEFPIAPSLLVASGGGGYHAYWLLTEPESDIDLVEQFNKRLQRWFRDRLKAVDATFSADRIWRIPGTLHHEAGRTVALVLAETSHTYSLDDFDFLPDVAFESASAEALVNRTATSGDIVPALSDHVLAALENDEKLAARWAGSMEGLEDKSRSGLTFAIEVLLARSNVPADEICAAVAQWCVDNAYPEGARRDRLRREVSKAVLLAETREQTAENKTFHATDVGNAQRFVRQHGENVRYVAPWKSWLVWDGTRWKLDEVVAVKRLAHDTAASIFREAADCVDSDMRKLLSKHAVSSEKSERLGAMLREAAPMLAIAPDSLDSDPYLLNCRNGTVDLRTGQLQPHDRSDLITKVASCDFPSDPGIDAPAFKSFLWDIFDGKVELIAYVQRLFGMALIGRPLDHILPILWGVGANGKSTLAEAVLDVMGDYASIAPPDILLVRKSDPHTSERADLFGRRLVLCSESDDGRRLSEATVKALTGDKKVKARRLFSEPFEFPASHTIVLTTNHRPVVRGTDLAIWRRLRLVPFDVTIPPERQDKTLADKLAAEAPGILRWLVTGTLSYLRGGLNEPAEVLLATDHYRAENDSMSQFLDECVERRPGVNASVRAATVYDEYRRWSERRAEHVMSMRRFGEQMAQHGFTKVKRGVYHYIDIILTHGAFE